MDGGIGELARLACRFQGYQILFCLQQFFAGALLRQPLAQDCQVRHRQLMVTASSLGFQGITQEELQPVQPDLRLLTKLAAQSRCLDRTLTQGDKLFQQFAASPVLLLLDIVEYPQRGP